jgi:hypothetical protein
MRGLEGRQSVAKGRDHVEEPLNVVTIRCETDRSPDRADGDSVSKTLAELLDGEIPFAGFKTSGTRGGG